ncbi:Fur family transcriptional regulator [Pedobacter glucosidilyticus]|uniref:Fur family transcriptional regulator n=1 Tax=Pedobacter glucosidilyticus TaxID=1122941 RepID=UPI000424A1A9|nr:transcriptional repressor [Pedobacter glucosidilyticus]
MMIFENQKFKWDMANSFTKLLEENDLKKTQPRLSVLKVLTSREMATSQPDLEAILGKEIDRVTLYRTLKTFEDKGIIHKVIDHKGTANYAMCSHQCNAKEHHHDHLHFNCTQCNHLYCLDECVLPQFTVPAGYQVENVQLIATGICAKCRQA